MACTGAREASFLTFIQCCSRARRCRALGEDMKTKILKALIWLALCLAVITTAGAAERWIKVANGKWDPNPKMLSDFKTKIETYVKSQAKAQGRELKNWKDYKFQYQGQEEKGKKYIFINALCDQGIKKRDLSKEIIRVFDGGSCFFSLKYDPERNEFFDLFINGEA
jgi:hypothetical protein